MHLAIIIINTTRCSLFINFFVNMTIIINFTYLRNIKRLSQYYWYFCIELSKNFNFVFDFQSIRIIKGIGYLKIVKVSKISGANVVIMEKSETFKYFIKIESFDSDVMKTTN